MVSEAKCLDPKWRYRRSVETNIRETFERARRELAWQQKGGAQSALFELQEGSSPGESIGARKASIDRT